MANNNFKRFWNGIQIKASYATDPVVGEIGEIYWNTAKNLLRTCVQSNPSVVWQDLNIDPGSVQGSVLQWNATRQSWVENPSVLTSNLAISAPNNSANAPASSFSLNGQTSTNGNNLGGSVNIQAGNASGTAQGGSVLIAAGGGGSLGSVELSGAVLNLDFPLGTDPVSGTAGEVYYNTASNVFKYYNGTTWLPIGSGVGGLLQIDLFDPIDTALPPTGAPVVIDGVTVTNGQLVLFSALISGNNEVYQATVVSGNVTAWTVQNIFSGNYLPSIAATVIIRYGTAFEEQIAVFNGTTWSINNPVRYFNSNGDYWEQSPLYTVNLANNTTGQVFAVGFNGSENIVVDYSILRGTAKETGQIILTTDGTNVGIASDDASTISAGVSFSGAISGLNLVLSYTTDNSGSSGTMKFSIKRWSDIAGGPAGPLSYSAGGGGSITGSGINGAIAVWSSGSILGYNSGLTFNSVTPSVSLGGLTQTGIQTATILDNQSVPATLFTYSAATYPYIVIEYGIVRQDNYATGRILVCTDGTSSNFDDDFTELNVTGVTLSVAVSGGNVEIQYLSSSTGFTGTFSYSYRAWS